MSATNRINQALLAATDFISYEELAAKGDIKKISAIRSRVSRLRKKGWLEGHGKGAAGPGVRLTALGRAELPAAMRKDKPKDSSLPAPPCFDSAEQFSKWRWAAIKTRENRGAYCRDCTPEYKERMFKAGRCKHLNVKFAYTRDGELVGLRGNVTPGYTLIEPRPAPKRPSVDGIAAPKRPALLAGLLEAAAMADAIAEIAKAARGPRVEGNEMSEESFDLDADE